MNILTIGGSGFLSGTLTRRALEQGHRVWAVTRGERPVPEGVSLLQADRKDEAAFRDAIHAAGTAFDVVIDCIAYKPEDVRQDLDVLAGVADHLVFISTDFVFDPAKRIFPMTEEHSAFLTDDSYGANKRRCEEILLGADPGDLAWTVLRPCHIYGPGSRLGCLPCHGRDPSLLDKLRAGEALRLVGAGHFLQQPIFARDLADVALACHGNPQACGRIFNTAGPDIVESAEYYRIIADAIGTGLQIEEVPVQGYLSDHPEHVSFLCHRIYALDALADAGLPVPSTPLAAGLREHVERIEDDTAG